MNRPPIFYFAEEPAPELVGRLKAAFPGVRFGVGPAERATVSDEDAGRILDWLDKDLAVGEEETLRPDDTDPTHEED